MHAPAALRRLTQCVLGACGLAVAATVGAAAPLERIVVTATRRPEAALRTPASISRIEGAELRLLSATHYSEALNRAAGTMIQRGSGAESLVAIRSPVLTGAGGCGAFLFLENGIPIRPVGFCNVNEMFEIDTEQADSIEVLRGPGSALYGSNAVHGTINVLHDAAKQGSPSAAGLDLGPADYARARVNAVAVGARAAGRLAALYTHDGGWRDESGFDEAKFIATLAQRADGEGGAGAADWRVDLASTLLEQETAGFIVGKDAYADEALARSNPNPEAFRDARATRLTGLWSGQWKDASIELRPFLRSSRMEFLQHFLLGQPLERNGQDSLGAMASASVEGPAWRLVSGLDLEAARSFLVEEQDAPTTGGSAAANAIRPAGLHYDYEVDSRVLALYAQYERSLGQRLRLVAGLRGEHVRYDYDNRMLAGNTDENGLPCPFGGCLYSRPADRSDDFDMLAPKLALSADLAPDTHAYLAWSRGFRPPEMTELYRLQRTQTVAELGSERIDALEIGIKGEHERIDYALAAFDMDKRDTILRESNGYNVDNGRTTHRGLEYELGLRPLPALSLAVAGSFARHEYAFTRAIEGGENIERGNDIDTAPRRTLGLRLGWAPLANLRTEAEWLVVGEYWLDAANTRRYGGHELLNLRAAWEPSPGWSLGARLDNALDRAYADRADFAFGNYRYFPGRGRTLFLSLDWRSE